MKAFLFIVWAGLSVCTQAVHAAPLGESGLADEARTEDFVHDVSVFDACYPVFRTIAACYVSLDSIMTDAPVRWAQHGDLPPSDHDFYYNFKYVRLVARRLQARYHSLQAAGDDEAFEKERLCRQLSAFRDTASVLPSVYTVIDGQYKGNVRSYVDALFSKSVMTNKKALKRFLLRPTRRQMQRDMGFQFVVSKLMYRAWEAQGRP